MLFRSLFHLQVKASAPQHSDVPLLMLAAAHSIDVGSNYDRVVCKGKPNCGHGV